MVWAIYLCIYIYAFFLVEVRVDPSLKIFTYRYHRWLYTKRMKYVAKYNNVYIYSYFCINIYIYI